MGAEGLDLRLAGSVGVGLCKKWSGSVRESPRVFVERLRVFVAS